MRFKIGLNWTEVRLVKYFPDTNTVGQFYDEITQHKFLRLLGRVIF